MRHEVETVDILHSYADAYVSTTRKANRDSAIALVISLIGSGLTYLLHQDPLLVIITATGTSSLVGSLRWRYLHVIDASLSNLMRQTVLASLRRTRGDNYDGPKGSATPPILPDSNPSPSLVPATLPPGSLGAEAEAKVAARV